MAPYADNLAFYSGFLDPGGGVLGWPRDEDGLSKIMERLRKAREREELEEEEARRLRDLFEPFSKFVPSNAEAASTPEALEGTPNLLLEENAAIAEDYMHDVMALTQEALKTTDKLESQGIDVSALRAQILDVGMTVPPLVLNPRVAPHAFINYVNSWGPNRELLHGLHGSLGHKAQLFISQPHGPQNTLSLAARQDEQAPVFLIGQHRGPAESFRNLMPANAPGVQHLADGTSFDRKFFDAVQEIAANPAPLPPLRNMLAERRAALNAEKYTPQPR